MELWIPLTILGAFMQNLRSAVQKHLKGRLTTLGAAYVRFLYASPFALLYLVGLKTGTGLPWPEPNLAFIAYCIAGGVSQILFTALLVYMFSLRNFAVGTTYSKTEVVQVAILGLLFLGDTVSLIPAIAIAVAMVGVMAMSAGQSRISVGRLLAGMTEKSTLVGLTCGAFLGASVVFFRGASLSLGYEHGAWMSAAFTLTSAVVLQTVGMGIYLAVTEPKTMRDVFVHWRWAAVVGLAGVLASIAWVTAFTLQNAAYVRALGQIELVFTFLSSVVIFRERTSRAEIVGILLVVVAILTLVLGH
ncbi:membrane protein [Thalassobaculum fulvum]|uniref:Membrane protein n=1 Tax=Thalassobaculum fulvum TaxID=1633335 RepID=A0A918XQC7_9PROT|nr:DMT family transporter [Thalassobaculum fulvum]GHD44405.1 membrane protein [Thalassobaculum fulvum]